MFRAFLNSGYILQAAPLKVMPVKHSESSMTCFHHKRNTHRPSSCTRPAVDNLQHPGHYIHWRKWPQAAIPGPALWSLLQRPQSSQHGRRGPRQHQSERQCAAGGRRADWQGRGTNHHVSATRDVHHIHWDHHHTFHHNHPQTTLTTYHSGKAGGRSPCVFQCPCYPERLRTTGYI